MKVNLLPTPKDLMLGKINQQFANDETAREYIESLFWPNGAVCPHCHNITSKRRATERCCAKESGSFQKLERLL
jgi:hypothetical protein